MITKPVSQPALIGRIMPRGLTLQRSLASATPDAARSGMEALIELRVDGSAIGHRVAEASILARLLERATMCEPGWSGSGL